VAGYVCRRLLWTVPVLFGVSFVVFLAMHSLPGDAAQQILGLAATEENASALRSSMGLDRPFIVQYAGWLGHTLRGDLGVSAIMRSPVIVILGGKLVNSLVLAAASLSIVAVSGFFLGTASAAHAGKVIDRTIVTTALALASAPVFWVGLVLLFAFGIVWPIFPTAGMTSLTGSNGTPDVLWHVVLPALTAAAMPAAIVTRVTRSAMIDTIGRPFIAAARGRGVSPRRILYVHAARNVLPVFANVCGLQIGHLFGGVVFTEIVFSWPGIGMQLFDSIEQRDIPMVQGCVLAIAVVFVLSNALSDVLVRALDVRSR
jgi:peptide/nickel transport system permease protein